MLIMACDYYSGFQQIAAATVLFPRFKAWRGGDVHHCEKWRKEVQEEVKLEGESNVPYDA